MFFRRGIRDDRWLGLKIAFFSVGALLAVVGMSFRNDWIVAAAAFVLFAGFLLRFAPGRDGEQVTEDRDEA